MGGVNSVLANIKNDTAATLTRCAMAFHCLVSLGCALLSIHLIYHQLSLFIQRLRYQLIKNDFDSSVMGISTNGSHSMTPSRYSIYVQSMVSSTFIFKKCFIIRF